MLGAANPAPRDRPPPPTPSRSSATCSRIAVTMAAGSHHPCALRPAHATRGGRAHTRPLLNAGPVGALEPGHPPKAPFPLSPTSLLPSLIAAASSDSGALAQVGSAQLVGGGRGGGRYAGGAGGALVLRVVRLARVDLAPPFPSPAPALPVSLFAAPLPPSSFTPRHVFRRFCSRLLARMTMRMCRCCRPCRLLFSLEEPEYLELWELT